MRKLWLIFAQTVTACLAVLFVVRLFYPQWLSNSTSVATTQPLNSAQSVAHISFRDSAKKAMPSVVNIFTTKKIPQSQHQDFMDDPLFRHFFGDPQGNQENSSPEESSPDTQQQTENSLGSGVIVSAEGFILTNNHVIAAADGIEVALADGRKMTAKVVGADPETDLAVIKIDAKNLPAITFAGGDGATVDTLKVGDVVLAIGNPFGVGQTVTQGIVSALGRDHLGINTYENFIQTDASINPGNSGGALIDVDGNLVGINSAIYSRSGGSMGIGFAIRATLAQQVMKQMISQGSVTRGWVGIEAQDITPELAESFKIKQTHGSLIAGVLHGSPAEKAGIKAGDILLAINGKEVVDSASMLNLISVLKPNNKATLKIVRAAKEQNVEVQVGKRPKAVEMSSQEQSMQEPD